MKLLIIEPNASGHRFSLYLKAILLNLRFIPNVTVFILTSHDALSSYQYLQLKPLLDDVKAGVYTLAGINTGNNSIFAQIKLWIHIRGTLKSSTVLSSVDHIYIPTADWIYKAIIILGSPFGSLPFSMNVLSPTFNLYNHSGSSSLFSYFSVLPILKICSISTLKYLFSIDEFIVNFFHSLSFDKFKKLNFVNDFGYASDTHFSYSSDSQYINQSDKDKSLSILVFGTIAPRKGISSLLGAACASSNNHISITIAGPMKDGYNLPNLNNFKTLAAQHRLDFRPNYQSMEDVIELFKSCDYVWLGYDKGFTRPSGVLHQAIYFKIPVISFDHGYIANFVKLNQLGYIFREQKDLVDFFNDCSHHVSNYELRATNYHLLRTKYSSANHAETVTTAILSSI